MANQLKKFEASRIALSLRMKQRITALDIGALCSELHSSIVSYRLSNIYNVLDSDRVFVLKFAIPDSKKTVVVDYGFKLYLSEYDRRLEPQPSNFVKKLRKHLKSKRLTNLKQVGNDRIVVLEFSNGVNYLVLEFFNAGNVILLDSNLEILMLQRIVNHKHDDIVDKYAVHEKYEHFDPKVLFEDSVKYFDDKDEEHATKPENVKEDVVKVHSEEEVLEWQKADELKQNSQASLPEAVPTSSKFHQKKAKGPSYTTIQKLLFLNCAYLSSDLIQKNLTAAGIKPSSPCEDLKNKEMLVSAVKVLNATEKEVFDILHSKLVKGYIVLRKNPLFKPDDDITSSLLGSESLDTEYTYEQFHPFKPDLKAEDLESGKLKIMEVNGYNNTLDKFFTSLDLLKSSMKLQKSKNLLNKKLNNVKQENDAKIQKLDKLQAANYRKAELIILNSEKIERCINAVQEALDQGMDWSNIESLIKSSQHEKSNDFVDMIVLPLNLKENKIKVRLVDADNYEKIEEETEVNDENSQADDSSLSDFDLSDDDDEAPQKAKKVEKPVEKNVNYLTVDIDLSMSAFANSETYFVQKKSAQLKKEKTEKTAKSALKNSERKINATFKKDLEKTNQNLSIRHARQKNWFEKFSWFISNEGYLIIAPKDDLQLEMIYYKYFNSEADYYVTADIEGSLKVFIKNPYKGQEVPPSTLTQAGMYSLSASKAWNQKILAAAWYVEGNRLTKKDINDGSLLPDGMLNIKGEKNFLPPCQLSFGIGLLWLLDDESVKRAKTKRLERESSMGLEIVKEIADVKEAAKERMEKLKYENKQEDLEKDKSSKSEPIVDDYKLSDEKSNDIKDEDTESPKDKKAVEMQDKNNKPSAKNNAATKKVSSRGKKSKLKKSQKYADQDEEDRTMKLKALGVFKQVEEQKSQEGKEKQDERKDEKKPVVRQRKKYNEQFIDILEEEIANIDYLAPLDSFTPKVKSLMEEKVIDIVPVFAPWQSLSKFKYKAKIQPGSGKIGKSMNEVLNYFGSRKANKESNMMKTLEEGQKNEQGIKSVDQIFDFDLDFEFEHQIISQLKSGDLQPGFTVKGVRVVLPSNASKSSSSGSNSKGKSGKKKK